LIHNSFAQSFLNVFTEKITRDTAFLAMLKQRNLTLDSVLGQINEDKKNANIILSKLKNDQNTFLKDNIYPIAMWVEAQENKTNVDELAEIANSYAEYLSRSKNLYDERKARYGLLLSQLLNNHEKLKHISNKLVQIIYKGLRDQQVIETPNDSRDLKESRAWYRYLFAYTNFILSQNSTQKEKIEYLKLAYQYSPDNLDKTVSNAYFYDMIFLFGEERKSFEEDYLAVLGSDDEKYKELLKMSMNDPSFKSKAKSLSKNATEFDSIWLTEFNKISKTAPSFSLPQIDKSIYTLGVNNKNKWTLIDFWGTWCGPCRKEHPELEKLYQRTKNGQITKLNVI
ncbi:MAG: TlpA family protein disulfide reductase, partial [Pedobacter sp.]